MTLKNLFLPNLRELNLSGLSVSLKKLAHFLRTALVLQKLVLRNAQNLDKGKLIPLPDEACHQLKEIDLAQTNVRFETVQFFKKRGSGLRMIDLSDCLNLSDADISVLVH